MEWLRCRVLDPISAGDIALLQSLHFAAPTYSQIVHGRLPDGREAVETLTSLPPGHSIANKTVLGFFLEADLIGVAELLKGYPEPDIAYIGLLLFSEAHQNRGFGRSALVRVYSLAAEWGCPSIRLAVIATNTRAHEFWIHQGFRELFRKVIPDVTGEAIVMQGPNPLFNPGGTPARIFVNSHR